MDLTLAAIVILSLWVIAIVAAGLVLTLRPGDIGVRFAPSGTAETSPGERQEILLGGDAEVLGTVRGRVQGVVLRPDTRQLLAVELGGSVLESAAVPAEAIVAADGQILSLAQRWEEPPDEPPANAATLRSNATVVGADGKRLGRLRLVCFDQASGTVTALVVEGRSTPNARLIPMDRIVEVGPDRIVTTVRAGDFGALQAFATDWDLREEIEARLAADPTLQRSLRIDVHDQRVRMQGYVADTAQADRVAALVRSIAGVLQLDLDLWTDADLARAVQEAIDRDPQTADARVQVTARTGVVDITGEAPDRSTARRIEAVARQVDGVEVVHNMVGVAQRASA